VSLHAQPLDVPAIKGHDMDGNEIERQAKDSEPFSALIFKIMADPFVGSLPSSGSTPALLAAGSGVYNSNKQRRDRIGRSADARQQARGHRRSPHRRHRRGGRLQDVLTGQTICAEDTR